MRPVRDAERAKHLVAIVALAMVACGQHAERSPRERIVHLVRALCGDAYRAEEMQSGEGPMTVHRCEWVEHGSWGGQASASFEAEGAYALLTVDLRGASAEVDAMQARALDLVAPLLDDAEQTLVRDLIAPTRRSDGASRPRVRRGNLGLTAQTSFDLQRPWERSIYVTVSKVGLPREIVEPEPSPIPDAELTSPIGPVDAAVLAAWRSTCLDDAGLTTALGFRARDPWPEDSADHTPTGRWTMGDRWVRCRVQSTPQHTGQLLLNAVWDPGTRAALSVHLSASDVAQDAFDAIVTRLLDPVLASAQRSCVRRASRETVGRAPTYRAPCDGIDVHSIHRAGWHELELTDDTEH